jgi:hypothetical protein
MVAFALVVFLIGATAFNLPPATVPRAVAAPSSPILVGSGFTDVSPHQIVRTSSNVLYVVAPTCDSYPSCPNNSLRVYRANQSGTPTSFTEQDTAHRPTQVGSAAVAIDGSDVLHVAWNDRLGNLNYNTFSTSAGAWGTTTVLDDATSWTDFGQGDEGVALALDANGAPHVAYSANQGSTRRVRYLTKAGGAWSSSAFVDDAPLSGNQRAQHPTLAFYPNGDLLLAWFVGTFNYRPDGTIYFRTRNRTSGAWGARSTIAGDTLMTTIDNGPSLLITSDGVAHVTFLNAGSATGGTSTNGDYVHYYYNSGAGWVANHPGGGVQITHNPSLGPGPNGTVRIYGHGWQGGQIEGHGDDLYYFQGGGASSWSAWTLFVTGQFDSSVTTRWAQFFQSFPQTLDIAYWADPYPNLMYVSTDVVAGGGTSTPTTTGTPTATNTATVTTPTATQSPTATSTSGSGTTIDSTSSQITFNGWWPTTTDGTAVGGSERSCEFGGSVASVSFTGTTIQLVYRQDTNRGQAQVRIDGAVVGTLDEYGPPQAQQIRAFTTTPGSHTLQLTVTRTRQTASSGYFVGVDAFIVGGGAAPTATQTSVATATWTPTATNTAATCTATSTTVPTATRTPTATNTATATTVPTATNTAAPTATATVVPTQPSSGTPTTVTFQVASAADDVNEDGTSFVSSGSTVWVGNGSSSTGSYTGLRFQDLAIPAGATIDSATLQLYSTQSQWISLSVSIGADLVADSAPFSSTSKPSQRTLTAQRMDESSNVNWASGVWYTLSDIRPVLQEVVAQSSWHSGQSVSIVIRGTGSAWARKSARSVEGAATQAARLVVTYH